MGMAGLPAIRNKSTSPAESRADKIRKLLDKGYTPRQIAKAMAKKDMGKFPAILRQAYKLAGQNKAHSLDVQSEVKGRALTHAPDAIEGLARRARTGRPDAVKLLLEVSGVHSNRTQHEHSGEVSIKLELPRPKPVDVPDADVVEDS